MLRRQRTGSVVCPSCGRLVGVGEKTCPNCGRPGPGMLGFTPVLRRLAEEVGLPGLVIGVSVVLYLATLVVAPAAVQVRGILGFLAPSGEALFAFGASGALPVFGYGRWWTLLSAGWLHGSLLHIFFNMMWVRNIAPAVVHLYGPGRTTILYVLSGVTGFAASTVAPLLPRPLQMILGSGRITVGASAALFGLLGALIHYSRRGGSRALGQQVWGWVIALFVFGFVVPGVDNWAHLGGFLGGWGLSFVLDPLKPERLDHVLAGLLLLLASAAAVVASILTGWGLLQGATG